jgi:ATP-binding cassette subfamily F protein 3
MLQIHGLSKHYGAHAVLDNVSFTVHRGEHAGLIGPNGAGKTTLFRCLTGDERPDGGTFVTSRGGAVAGYLPQTFDAGDATVGEVIAAARFELHVAGQALEAALVALVDETNPAALADYDDALARFEALGGYAREARAASVTAGLGLDGIDPARSAASLSGGQKTRLALAALLLREPDVLLLDEPTNHLDVAALEWLEEFVRGYPGTALIVSHDRAFLDRTVTRILYLDPATRGVLNYAGNYSDFAAARAAERAAQRAAWTDQQQYIAETHADIARVRGRAQSIQNGPKRHRDHYGKVSAKVAKLAKARERKLERFLESEERVEKPRQSWGLKLDFGPPPPGGRAVLRLEQVAFAYPGGPPLLGDVTLDVRHGERIGLTGPNGAGKTTLLRLIEGRLQPDAGLLKLGANIRLGVLAQEGETLDPERSVLQTALAERAMSETEARTFLHAFLFAGDSAFRAVGRCSPGERTRLQLARLVLRGCNLLLLDEPLNHLDIEGREHFEAALAAFTGTVIVVSHDRAFVHSYAERLLDVRDGRVRELRMVGGRESASIAP